MSSLLSSTRNTRQWVSGSFRYIRGDVPAQVTPEDIRWLLTHNIRTVVDLRSLEEVEQTPYKNLFIVPKARQELKN